MCPPKFGVDRPSTSLAGGASATGAAGHPMATGWPERGSNRASPGSRAARANRKKTVHSMCLSMEILVKQRLAVAPRSGSVKFFDSGDDAGAIRAIGRRGALSAMSCRSGYPPGTAASSDYGHSGPGTRPGMPVRSGGPVPLSSVSGILAPLEGAPEPPTAGPVPDIPGRRLNWPTSSALQGCRQPEGRGEAGTKAALMTFITTDR